MVSQTSGITTSLSRESTSGLMIRQLPLTIRSGFGVLDNQLFFFYLRRFKVNMILYNFDK